MEPFARTIDAATKYIVSSTLDRIDWNAELVRADLGKAVQQLKRESGRDCSAKARELTERAVDSAIRADSKEVAAIWQANAALQQAAYGNARKLASQRQGL